MDNNLVIKLADKTIEYFKGDPKRVSHFQKVHSFARIIGIMEGLHTEKLEILELAAIVHDIGIKVSEKKYNSTIGKYQELEGPPIAETLLRELGSSEKIIERVSFLVGHHHTYQAIDDIDFQILVEADFLVNLYEDCMGEAEAVSVRDKYFKTAKGIEYINTLFVNKQV